MCFSWLSHSASLPGNISQQQMEQFQRLPPAQQRALAQSMGIDLNSIQSSLSSSPSGAGQESSLQTQPFYPRGTEFDEFGNPIILEDEEEEEDEEDAEPKPFGYDVFANEPTSFMPTMDIAIPEGYIVGSGDVLNIQVFGKENINYLLPVSREGVIVIPDVGPYMVSGLSFTEMKAFIGDKVRNKILGVDTVITLAEMRSMRVFVLGDAYKPGPYVLSSLSTITHALFAAGGISDIGSLRNIQLKRAGKLVITLDLYDLLIQGDSSNDVTLRSGDVIFISPVGDRVTVKGEVTRAAIYELTHDETFKDVIKMAGGLLPSAYPASTVVERYNKQNLRSLLNIDLSDPAYLKKYVNAGDYIRVMPTSDQFDDSVTIIGAVARPGNYQWVPGQRISDLLPNLNSYLLNDADLNYSIIVREKDLGRNIEVLQFSLFNALSASNSEDDIVLQARDKLLVFSNSEEVFQKNAGLNDFAFTRTELQKREKELAKLEHENRLFWKEFGTEQQTAQALEEKDELEEQLKLASQSIAELSGGQVLEETDINDLGVFSRKRLLTPVVQQLKRQGGSGQAIQLVEIVGAVKYPGVYPLSNNQDVKNLIAAAGGLLESAYLTKAEISRSEVDKQVVKASSINVDLKNALSGATNSDYVLRSKDRLNIHQIPAWQENHFVELRGEFLFPGKYTIRRGETIAQLIGRAGGFTKYAYQEGSVFTREKLKQIELQNLLKVSSDLRMEIASKSLTQTKGGRIDYAQAKKLLADLTKVQPVGRLVIELPKILASSNFDVLLENGDLLYVPTKQNSVNVIGQVQLSSSHLFQKGLSPDDYVRLSGGTKRQADEERLYVIKANGSVLIPNQKSWFSSKGNEDLSPGDTVVIPLDSEYRDSLTLWSTATQIIYQAAVAIAAISGI